MDIWSIKGLDRYLPQAAAHALTDGPFISTPALGDMCNRKEGLTVCYASGMTDPVMG
jgi:hypothetical protein